jgi:hypothetical protein
MAAKDIAHPSSNDEASLYLAHPHAYITADGNLYRYYDGHR